MVGVKKEKEREVADNEEKKDPLRQRLSSLHKQGKGGGREGKGIASKGEKARLTKSE